LSRRGWLWLLAVGFLAGLGYLAVGSAELGAASSALSADARGWLAARRYLEARGARVVLRDTPLADEAPELAPEAGVLVLAFPWQLRTGSSPGTEMQLRKYAQSGGTVVFAYSGRRPGPSESAVMTALGLDGAELRPPPPLSPFRWWRYQRESWRLRPEEPGWPELAVGAFRHTPTPPPGARVLHRDPGGNPLVFAYRLNRGRVVALPAGVLANARITEAGNADFLETLHRWLGPEWTFDEYHHGLVDRGAVPEGGSPFAWDLFTGHLALIYLLALLALGRRFGPPWREAEVAVGSTASFLRDLGALHHRLRHHGEVAPLLVERVRRHDPRLELPEEIDEEAAEVDGGGKLVALARRLAGLQRRRI
jgi:hypothetical protein